MTHKEFIKDVVGSTNFAVEGFSIQPGNSGVFPWLSNIAKNYQQYKIKSMDFVFRSTSADSVSANTSLGSVMLCHEADASAAAPRSKQDMLTMAGVRDTKPSLSVKLSIDVNAARTNADNTHYIRTDAVPLGASEKEYDYGDFYLATQGMDASVTTIGELWVVYTIELLRPQLPNQEDGQFELAIIPTADLTYQSIFGVDNIASYAAAPLLVYDGVNKQRVTGSSNLISFTGNQIQQGVLCFSGLAAEIGKRYEITIGAHQKDGTSGISSIVQTNTNDLFEFGDNLLNPIWTITNPAGAGAGVINIRIVLTFTLGGKSDAVGDVSLGASEKAQYPNCIVAQNFASTSMTDSATWRKFIRVREVSKIDAAIDGAPTFGGATLHEMLEGQPAEGNTFHTNAFRFI